MPKISADVCHGVWWSQHLTVLDFKYCKIINKEPRPVSIVSSSTGTTCTRNVGGARAARANRSSGEVTGGNDHHRARAARRRVWPDRYGEE